MGIWCGWWDSEAKAVYHGDTAEKQKGRDLKCRLSPPFVFRLSPCRRVAVVKKAFQT
jgi:hypothetical protein